MFYTGPNLRDWNPYPRARSDNHCLIAFCLCRDLRWDSPDKSTIGLHAKGLGCTSQASIAVRRF